MALRVSTKHKLLAMPPVLLQDTKMGVTQEALELILIIV